MKSLLQFNRSKLAAAFLLGLSTVPAMPVLADETPSGWYRSGEQEIAQRRSSLGSGQARNVVLFVGDGMSLTTVTAARILAGQRAGESGEGHRLAFESFPNLALAKTYNTNQQTPDSAGTMTAMATGVKTYAGAIAVDQRVDRTDCESVPGRELVSLLDLAKSAGLAAGIVSTARITHATPAVLYAKSPERRWELDAGMPPSAREAGCRDIARQLVDYEIGGGIEVVFGGGRSGFIPAGAFDPEYDELRGRRQNPENLIEAWQQRNDQGRFVWNRSMFDLLDADQPGNVLGLFEPSHMQYEHDRPDDGAGEPSLEQMTVKALEILQRRQSNGQSQGFVLVVEAGRIDHAHHGNNAFRALTDTIAFSEAIAATMERIDTDETLVIVTADHAHALTFGGYGERGNPILGLVNGVDQDGGPAELSRDINGKPFTSLNYTNGPGYRPGPRPDYTEIDPQDPDFQPEALIGLPSGTHSGEDVPVYAAGPGSEALRGSIEQHLIFHAMVQAHPALAGQAEKIKGEDGLPQWLRLQQLLESPAAEAEPAQVAR